MKMLTGDTGCGKTFHAIKMAKEKGSFVVAVPCRQLAYEIFLDYPSIESLRTGEVSIGRSPKNTVCVYESLYNLNTNHKTLIVDECHYLNDPQRGGELFEFIDNWQGDVILCTATNTLSDEVMEYFSVEEIELQPLQKTEKKEISINDFIEKVQNGMQAIVFTKYVPSITDKMKYENLFGVKCGLISADTPTLQRVKTQIDFRDKKLQVVLSTNVLAQGVNFPAEGVYIEYNEYDSWEIITQKIGRVARPFKSNGIGYYCLSYIPNKSKNSGLPQKNISIAERYRRKSGIINIEDWNIRQHELPWSDQYRGFKYSLKFLRKLRDKGLSNREAEMLCFLENQNKMLNRFLKRKKQMINPADRLLRGN